jgi:hypothetical protein
VQKNASRLTEKPENCIYTADHPFPNLQKTEEDTTMPKNTVNDPITDQEMAFAHLVLSGTMNDRAAAEAAGLNPDTASYTKSKPRVRDYMLEHRNAVREKLVDLEAEGQRKLNLGRDQVLARLWELANLSHEVTRGTIAGQIKALSMIVAIEGLIPGRPSPSETKPTAPPVKAEIYEAEWLRKQQQYDEPGDAVVPPEAEPGANQVPHPEHAPQPTPPPERNHSVANPFIEGRMRVPDATGSIFDAALDTTMSLRLPFSIQKGRFGKRR